MAYTLFKTRYLPNADGSDSATALTDVNTVWVNTYLGDDNTGDGTNAKPYRSAFKANQKAGVSYIVFRGIVNEYFATTKIMIGDDLNQQFINVNYVPNFLLLSNLTTDYYYTEQINYHNPMSRLVLTSDTYVSTNSNGVTGLNYSLIKKTLTYGGNNGNGNPSFINCTIYGLSTPNQTTAANYSCKNNLWIKQRYFPSTINFGYQVYVYNIYVSNLIFKYNLINTIQPNFGNDSKANVTLARNVLIVAGMTTSNALIAFPQDIFGNETCRIVKQSKDGGTSPNLLNRYDTTLTGTLLSSITANQALLLITLIVADSSKFASTGDIFIPNATDYTANGVTISGGSEVFTYTSITINSPTSITFNGPSYTFKVAHTSGVTCTRYGDVLDFTLNPDPNNEALYASDTGGYVGCFKPVIPINSISNTYTSVINVNSDGTDSGSTGNLLVQNSDDSVTFNTSSGQTWNRFRSTNVIALSPGNNFTGAQGMTTDGTTYGTYFGKNQVIMATSTISPGATLTVGTWYKVINATKIVNNAIVYNGVTYLPGYTFLCVVASTVYALSVGGSGTVVKAIIGTPMESMEILPYSDMTTPSVTVPSFSAPLVGTVMMLFNKTSLYGTIDAPVKFSDTHVLAVCPLRLPSGYYNSWGITNADPEFVLLASDTTNYYYKTPVLRFLKIEINGHYDSDYGQ